MAEFFDSAKLLAGAEIAAVIAFVLSFVAALYSLIVIRLALRAKKRARRAIIRAKREVRDARMRALLASRYNARLTEKDIILLRKIISKDEMSVSPGDMRYIDRGLTQSSPDGVQRYAKDLLGAA